MIDTINFRPGDIVWEDYGGYRKIVSFSDDKESVTLVGLHWGLPGSFSCSAVEPAGFCKEVLDSLGFGQKVFTQQINDMEWEIQVENNIYLRVFDIHGPGPYVYLFESGFTLTTMDLDGIKYFHQLQKVYEDLTGKKLIIKKNEGNSNH